jgi:hypothetical protein
MFSRNAVFDNLRRFQKCLRRATAASTPSEAMAAEAAARRIMEEHDINPVKVPDKSVYDRTSFADNTLLLKLREERLALELKRKHKHKRKRGPKAKGPRQKVDQEDIERIRLLYNEGLSSAEIGKQLGYIENTVNSVRYRHHNVQKKWAKDAHGKFHWATARSAA